MLFRSIWGSLWSLPEHADADAARAWFAARIDADFDAAESLTPIAHGFTHDRLQIQPLRWRATAPRPVTGDNAAPGELRWIARDALAALGLPSPIRKLLEG